LLVTIGRAKVYATLSKIFYHLFYGEAIPKDCKGIIEKFGEIDFNLSSELVKELRGSVLIKDMPISLAEVYEGVMKDFYERYGFQASELHADHIAVELAFMSKLVEREISLAQQMDEEELYKIRAAQHRFIKTHLQPLVKNLPSAPLLNFVRDFVREDAKYLYSSLVGEKREGADND